VSNVGVAVSKRRVDMVSSILVNERPALPRIPELVSNQVVVFRVGGHQ